MLRTIALLLLSTLLWVGQAWAGVNVNTATASELETLPGIGPSKAAAIIEYRTANGPFASVDQLDNVPGIGPATLANIRAQVEIGPGQAGGAAAQTAQTQAAESAQTATQAAPAADSAGKININTASQGQLEGLPGIGPSKAAAIVEYRTANGPFASCSALQNVTGIGPATVASVEPVCTVK